MPRTLYLAASSGYRSVSTLTTMAQPAMPLAVRATSSADIRHGPHHSAQKSTSTGTRALCVISSNCSGSTSNGSFIGDSGDLHAPQRPVSARCLAGTRFFCPQVVQARMTGIEPPSYLMALKIGCKRFVKGIGRCNDLQQTDGKSGTRGPSYYV